ncbi:hypothetical protein [Nostocoides sp. HKS02]|uniref:hypothetical protein n=1 Tax=Nostocoides sp. HKS02 TaxID=1813880 RepID=UPI0012B47320|nr:hypothetical protein [Tetrasphaera sp. HKS02]QGN58085.1 hypothetical protein GKE56_09495 [Tetrasphaera sp. HKS02]
MNENQTSTSATAPLIACPQCGAADRLANVQIVETQVVYPLTVGLDWEIEYGSPHRKYEVIESSEAECTGCGWREDYMTWLEDASLSG